MKKFKLLLCLLLSVVCLNVYAATASVSISGTNKINVGETANIYIKLNASDLIEGVNVKYSVSGNLEVVSASVNSSLDKMGQNGTEYILYAQNPIASGSTILTIKVKGTGEGTGTVSVDKMQATVSDSTVTASSKSYTVNVATPTTTTTTTTKAATTSKATTTRKKTTTSAKKTSSTTKTISTTKTTSTTSKSSSTTKKVDESITSTTLANSTSKCERNIVSFVLNVILGVLVLCETLYIVFTEVDKRKTKKRK